MIKLIIFLISLFSLPFPFLALLFFLLLFPLFRFHFSISFLSPFFVSRSPFLLFSLFRSSVSAFLFFSSLLPFPFLRSPFLSLPFPFLRSPFFLFLFPFLRSPFFLFLFPFLRSPFFLFFRSPLFSCVFLHFVLSAYEKLLCRNKSASLVTV